MVEIRNLREALTKQVDACQQRLEWAKLEAQAAIASVETIEKELAVIRADVDQRVAAIALVEQMLNEADGQSNLYPYRNMNQEDAMRGALKRAGKPLNSSDLADALKAGGYLFTSTNPANSIGVAANTNRKGFFSTTKEGNRTLIGLKEWGPEMQAADPFADSINDNIDSSDIGPGALGFGQGSI
jgi:hypothetical protein